MTLLQEMTQPSHQTAAMQGVGIHASLFVVKRTINIIDSILVIIEIVILLKIIFNGYILLDLAWIAIRSPRISYSVTE